jgi:hypothetical protein
VSLAGDWLLPAWLSGAAVTSMYVGVLSNTPVSIHAHSHHHHLHHLHLHHHP